MMKIGVCGPVDISMLDWNNRNVSLPPTSGFPLVTHFVNALLRRGFEVVVYTTSGNIQKSFVHHDGFLTVCVIQEKSQPGRRFFQHEVNSLKKHILAYPADIISAFWTYEYAWAALRSGIPTVVSIHDVAHKILFKQFDMFRLVRFIMNEIVVRKAKYLLANSAYTYRILPGWLKKKTTTINNFYPAELSNFPLLTIEKGNYIVSAVQGFTKRKGIPKALKAFALLRKQYPKLEYHLIGVDYEEGGRAQAYAQKHNLAGGVKFLGCMPVEDVFKHMAGAKVMLHPSQEESFGMAVLEAMVAGTAVVGGKDSGFIPYLLDYGKAGELCNIYSAKEIAAAVSRLLSSSSLRESYTCHARRFAEQNFSESVILAQHLKYYSQVLDVSLHPDALTAHKPAQTIKSAALRVQE